MGKDNSSMTIATINPATGQTLRTFVPLTEPELDARLQCAADTFRRYRRTPIAERSRLLLRAAEILESEKEKFGRLMVTEMGKTLKAAVEVLKEKAVRRQVSLKALHFGPIQPAAKGTSRQSINLNVGISEEKARELVKFVKALKVKVQSHVQGDQVRITGKSKDDLQVVMKAVKDHDFDVPLQFANFRP